MNVADEICKLLKELEELSEEKYKLYKNAPRTSNLKNAPIEPQWFRENISPLMLEIKKRRKEIERLRSSELNPSNKL